MASLNSPFNSSRLLLNTHQIFHHLTPKFCIPRKNPQARKLVKQVVGDRCR